MLPRAASAAPIRFTSVRARLSSFFNCWTTPDRFAIDPPRLGIIADSDLIARLGGFAQYPADGSGTGNLFGCGEEKLLSGDDLR
jgi:hypothetical protein